MLTPAQRAHIDVVLVSPRNPLNIGAVARAMANFAFDHLSVVSAFDPHWREARSAVGAPALLQNARSTTSLAEAVAPCAFVAGTGTLTHRKPEQPVVSLADLAPMLQQALAGGGRAAIVFGPEKHGLTRNDLSYCNVLVEIPTDPRQPSMNLGQAAAVCLYELIRPSPEEEIQSGDPTRLFKEGTRSDDNMTLQAGDASEASRPSTSERLERLGDLIEQVMLASHYSPESMRNANRHDVRVFLRRLSMTDFDVRRAMGLFRRILNRLTRGPSNRLPRGNSTS